MPGIGHIQGRGDEPIGIRTEEIDCDAVVLQRAHAAGDLEQVVELYRGDFLPGHFASNAAPELDDWLSQTRERLRDLALEAARTLAKRWSAARRTRASHALGAARAARFAPTRISRVRSRGITMSSRRSKRASLSMSFVADRQIKR